MASPNRSSRNSTGRAIRRPISPLPPASSIYSQQSSAASMPVSPLSTAHSVQQPGNPNHRAPAGAPPPPSHRRPNSSTFFRPADMAAAGGGYPLASGINNNRYDFNDYHDDNDLPGGYDGAYDHLRSPPPTHSGDDNVSRGSGSGSGGSGGGKDKKKSKSSNKHKKAGGCLKVVDRNSLSAGAKAGIWLMGTTPEKLEQAARAQKDRREREREERREKKQAKREMKRAAGRGPLEDGGGEYDEGDDVV
ncbi:hypothetical protein C8A00DRAFT_38990, partial [Chaetomidium leptoderma]